METNTTHLFKDIDNLLTIETIAWDLLQNSTLSYKDEFHLMAFSYLTVNNEIKTKTVVNRFVDVNKKQIDLHTDYRGNKIKSITLNNNTHLLFYCRKRSLQLRLKCKSEILYNCNICKERWNKTRPDSKICYMQKLAPSTNTEDIIYKNEYSVNHAIENPNFGFENFCIVRSSVLEMDLLKLSSSGHWRCNFKYDTQGNIINKHWLAP